MLILAQPCECYLLRPQGKVEAEGGKGTVLRRCTAWVAREGTVGGWAHVTTTAAGAGGECTLAPRC